MDQNQEKYNDENGEIDFGEVFFSWKVPEFEQIERTKRWYLVMVVLGLALLVYSLFMQNYLFSLIIILITFIVFLRTYNNPRELDFLITEDGIVLGQQFFDYSIIKKFYFIYKPPIKKLYFDLGTVSADLSIPLYDINPVKVREKLLEYLSEDLTKDYQTIDDQLNTLLKL